MTKLIPVLFAAAVGFTHAFEADHLVAVSSIVSKRTRLWLAIKDGIYWGLGHTSTILLMGMMVIVGKMAIDEKVFSYLEAGVGIMLMAIGLLRIKTVWNSHRHGTHTHLVNDSSPHHVAYGVGMVHGLAGSGVMILLVMTEIKEPVFSLAYLLIFGLGSVVGMLVASGLFSMPFSKVFSKSKKVQMGLIIISSLFCFVLGGKILFDHLSVL